jgi:hypothetical protein
MPTYSDADYAAALNTRPPGNLPAPGQKDTVVWNGETVDVPTGQLLARLTGGRRRAAPKQELLEALERHGLTAYQNVISGRWELPFTGDMLSDADYAAALNNRLPGDLSTRGQRDSVMRNGQSIDVPTGRLLTRLRSRGRWTDPAPVLVEALERHGLALHRSSPQQPWKLRRSGRRAAPSLQSALPQQH